MSEATLRRITDAFTAKLADFDRVPDPMGFLTEVTTALARDNAETVFFKVQTEPGWTQDQAQAVADKVIHEHVIGIADVMHANGCTIEMAQNLGRVAATAYGTRLAELTVSYGPGGRA